MTDAPTAGATPEEEASWLASRRRLPLLALAAVLLFAAVAGALAWRQYRDAQRTALHDARSRAVVAAAVFNVYFSGELGTLSSIAQAPAVRNLDQAGMLDYFRRVAPRNGKLFNGGLAWIDRNGRARVSTSATGKLPNVSDRDYFATTFTTGKPFVSEGLTSRVSQKQVIVMAVPTRDAQGRITGVLAGTLLIKPTRTQQADDRPRVRGTGHPRPEEPVDPVRLRTPPQPARARAVRNGHVGRPQRHARARRRLGTCHRLRPRAGSGLDRRARPAALRRLRGRTTQSRPRARPAREGGAAHPCAARLDHRRGRARTRARSSRTSASADSGTRRSTRSP